MTLVLELEFLSGVSFAALGPDSDAADWPPQPDRVFSALVATWAARGQDGSEGQALEWLEKLPPPRILASEARPRTSAIVFVPPNDARSGKRKHAKDVLPHLRARQPRRFPASRPDRPVARLLWPGVTPAQDTLGALQRLAHDTAYVGHSASLTRCCFLLEDNAWLGDTTPSRRRVYPGRFSELRGAFDAGHRPLPGALVAAVPNDRKSHAGFFGGRWLLFEHVTGVMPDLRAFAFVAKALRDALLSGYRRTGLGDVIPEIVSGHSTSGTPSREPHLAIVPLSFVGFPYADGHVMGIGLIAPRGSTILEDENFRHALRTLAPIDEEFGRRILTLTTRRDTPSNRAFSVGLSPTFEPPRGKRSLDPALYCRSARAFATVTPIVLDRHLKQKGLARQEETEIQIRDACRNVGLPEPQAVHCDKHAIFEGSPPAYPSAKSPPWMRWRLPQSLSSRQLTHAVVSFREPVEGPVVLGAGRFTGLGLCRPLDSER